VGIVAEPVVQHRHRVVGHGDLSTAVGVGEISERDVVQVGSDGAVAAPAGEHDGAMS
jgi:hypothetical protein